MLRKNGHPRTDDPNTRRGALSRSAPGTTVGLRTLKRRNPLSHPSDRSVTTQAVTKIPSRKTKFIPPLLRRRPFDGSRKIKSRVVRELVGVLNSNYKPRNIVQNTAGIARAISHDCSLGRGLSRPDPFDKLPKATHELWQQPRHTISRVIPSPFLPEREAWTNRTRGPQLDQKALLTNDRFFPGTARRGLFDVC